MLINIQFLRAFAAILVLLFHAVGHYLAMYQPGSESVLNNLNYFGYFGVDIFFVISGYIIWVSTRNIKTNQGVFKFLYNRISRIFLGYWPYFIVFYLVVYFYNPDLLDQSDLIGSFFLTQPKVSKILLNVSWTLRYELYFYLSFTVLLFLAKDYIFKILALAVLLIVSAQLWAIYYLNIYEKDFESISLVFTFYLSPYCLEFIAGCYIAKYFENKSINYLSFILVGGLTFFVLALAYQMYYLDGTLHMTKYMNKRVLLFGLTSVFILVGLVELENRKVIIFPRFSLLLGGASYSIYLSHTIILYYLYHIGLRTAIKEYGEYQSLFMLLILCFIVFYSILHYKLIEKPLLKQSRKLYAYFGSKWQ